MDNNLTREQRSSFADQLRSAQAMLDRIYRDRGLTFDPATRTANRLPTATAPSSAADVRNFSTVNLPNSTPTSGNTASAIASTAGATQRIRAYETQQAAEADDKKAQRDALLAAQGQNQSYIANFLADQTSTSDLRKQAFDDIGYDPKEYFADQKAKIAEIEKLTEDYNAEVARRDEEIARIKDNSVGALTTGVDAEVARAEAAYAIKLNQKSANINAKSGVLEALQGNFSEAQAFVNQAVEDSVADQKFKLDSLLTLYELNEDSINRLDSQYQDAFGNALNLAEKQYDRSYQEAKDKGDLLIEAAQNGIDLSSYMNSSYSEMQNAFASQAGGGTGRTAGFLNTDIESDVREDAVSLLESVDNGDITIDKAFSRLRTLYSPREASDAAIRSLLGIADPQSAAQESLEVSPIEAEIQRLSASGILQRGDIRESLRRRGFSAQDINRSSIGNQFSAFGDSIYNFLFGRR